jgi:signal transduction histidine kinase
MALLLGVGLPLLVGLVALMTWWVTGRAMRPVEAIRSEVSAIGERELHRRVPEPPTDDEVGRLARTMNAMLARLDESAERQRRFVSDASHELQSPLTSLRSARSRSGRATSPTGGPATAGTGRGQEMQRPSTTCSPWPVSTPCRIGARPRRPDDLYCKRPNGSGREAVPCRRARRVRGVLGDPDQLRRALRNVLDNAERHAASDVAVSVQETDAHNEVVIADDGAGIPAEHRDRIFERFGRIDDARTRDGASTGLGLAITREIVEAHGGAITVEECVPDGGGARFVLCFPTAETAV